LSANFSIFVLKIVSKERETQSLNDFSLLMLYTNKTQIFFKTQNFRHKIKFIKFISKVLEITISLKLLKLSENKVIFKFLFETIK